jgi:peptide/nickel transport system substrate-binding protein
VNVYTHPLPGTGPYRYVSQTADAVHFEAWPGYHGGVPATREVDFVRSAADGSDLVAGTLDISPGANLGNDFRATAPSRDVEVVTLPTPGQYAALVLNVRPGRLFSDLNLRKALQLCIDLPRSVDAVTAGAGTPFYSPVLPGTDAYAPDLPKPGRDVAEAKRLIEASGWALGADGVYARGGERLATSFPVRLDQEDRVKMSDLIALQARDCGIDLRATGLDGDAFLSMLGTYPHDIPDTKTPFDLAVVKWYTGIDAGDGLGLFATAQVTSAENPDGNNIGGFSDPAFDRLIEAGAVTYDQDERARLYREAQQELASQVPAIFLWGMAGYDAFRSAVRTVDGPIDLTASNWAWQPERLVVAKSGS